MSAVATKERGILFSAPMVRAILDGRKTQTRRAIKPQPGPEYAEGWYPDRYNKTRQWNLWGAAGTKHVDICGPEIGRRGLCPYGIPGDRLWVRESWGLLDTEPKDGPEKATVFYRETDGDRHDLRHQLWRPSLFMPRWASRITLEIMGVRVHRLHEISEEDAIAEGVQTERDHYGGDTPLMHLGSVRWHRYNSDAFSAISAAESYRTLWESINGAGSWEKNPWVWAITFKRLEAT